MARESSIQCQMFDARDIAAYLGISKSGAFNLLHADGFPSITIGKRLLVRRADFETWLQNQAEKGA